MKKVITILITFALILALAPAAFAGPVEIRITDDGTVPQLRLHAAPAQAIDAGPLRLTVNEVRLGSTTNDSRYYSPGLDARPGETVTIVSLNVTVGRNAASVFSFDPRAVQLTADSGETANCWAYSTTQFLTTIGPGEAETGALVFILHETDAAALESFTLDFLPPFTSDGGDLAEPIALHFVIES